MMEVAVEQPAPSAASAESIDKPTTLPATVSLSTTSTPAPAPEATTAEAAAAPAPTIATENPPAPPPEPASTDSSSVPVPVPASTSASGSAAVPGPSSTSPPPPAAAAPAPAPAHAATEGVNGDKPAAENDPDSESVTQTPRRRKKKNNSEETESELSEPDSTLHSPLRAGPITHSPRAHMNELDEIVVGSRAASGDKPSAISAASNKEDEIMTDAPDDEPLISHYPKRKRTSIFEDLSESKIEIPTALPVPKIAPQPKPKATTRPTLGSDRGVILGYWRDSRAPDEDHKHAVIGFIDVRDRLRTRLQANNRKGESLVTDFPLPPGPGGTWVTFERIVFEKHLVGLDSHQVKEYVRVRADAGEETPEERAGAEKEAVTMAIQRVKANPLLDNPTVAPMVAYGPELPDVASTPRPDSKRRRISGGFATINPAPPAISPAPTNGNLTRDASMPPPSKSSSALMAIKNANDPLLATRPTRILVGYWRVSSELDPKDKHAIYGILGQNDMFRVKLVRETRDGRFLDGNFPLGAGALWVNYDEVELEPHLNGLSRGEIKEYCRIRQWQIDNGETSDERIANETTAVYDAQERIAALSGLNGVGYKSSVTPIAPALPTQTLAPEEALASEQLNGKAGAGGHDLRQSRREAKVDGRTSRHSLPDSSDGRSATRAQTVDAQERTSALARREIARAEAAQGRADRLAVNRERAAAAAAADVATAVAAATAASSSPALTNGRVRFHESEDMQRLNKVWARQESLRAKAGAEDAKVYDGVKYERKGNGPFMGKLVSQGSIINIDGEDYVEYRVLTKPSFF